jgi:hypothetical protein
MVVYFNHNQENSGDAINQDLFIWAQLKLVDDAGLLPTLYFYVTSTPGTALNNFGTPGDNTAAYTGPQRDATSTYPTGADGTCTGAGDTFPQGGIGSGTGSGDACYMVQARGQVCLNGPVGIGTPVPCDGSGGAVVATVNENLGADEVANAIVFPEINNILRLAGFGGYDVLQADIRMGCNPAMISGGVCPPGSALNNGFEQIFIGQLRPTLVPEPATWALLGLGLLFAGGLGRFGRRKL